MKARASSAAMKLRQKQKVWALRILRLVRVRSIKVDHPDAARAFSIIGQEKAVEIINGGPKPKNPPARRADAMDRRLAGSFESNRRRH